MATVIFYEKPGCINNAKQKALLLAAGHLVQARSLLRQAWTVEELRPFFGDLPVAEWFNRTAPQIKSREVNPEQVDEDTALHLMIANPLLIRRPLMVVGDRRMVGFDPHQVDLWISLQSGPAKQKPLRDVLMHQDLQTCPNDHPGHHKICQLTEVQLTEVGGA